MAFYGSCQQLFGYQQTTKSKSYTRVCVCVCVCLCELSGSQFLAFALIWSVKLSINTRRILSCWCCLLQQRFHAARPCLGQQFGRDSWPMRRRQWRRRWRRKTLIGGRAMGLRCCWLLWRFRLQLGQDLRGGSVINTKLINKRLTAE